MNAAVGDGDAQTGDSQPNGIDHPRLIPACKSTMICVTGSALRASSRTLVPNRLSGNVVTGAIASKPRRNWRRIECSERRKTMAEIWPQEIRLLKDRRTLLVCFDNGETHALSAEYLRTHSPSAEVQGHSPEQRKTVSGKEKVEILKVERVGNYAVKLHFDDMHDTGIFSWGYLRKLGQEFETRWPAYLDELAEKRMKRSR
jgi:DUF971 family protein